jgi:hemolysin activation/secretion protein
LAGGDRDGLGPTTARTTLTFNSGDNVVPFYLMPTLGGGNDLRGFSTMRFRGPQRVLVSGELRWTPARMLDMAVFYDAGRVADRPRDLALRGLESSYGVGARFHGQRGTFMRWDLAHSREHALHFIWAFGAAF